MSKHDWEYFPIKTNVVLLATDPKTGKVVKRYYTHNLVVNSGKVLVARMLMEDSGFDTGITYCEVGTNNAAPNVSQTTLSTALRRKAITSYIRTSNVVQFRTFFPAADVTAYVKEVGLFGHSTATTTLGTGEMFNRATVDFDNSAGTNDLTVAVKVTFG